MLIGLTFCPMLFLLFLSWLFWGTNFTIYNDADMTGATHKRQGAAMSGWPVALKAWAGRHTDLHNSKSVRFEVVIVVSIASGTLDGFANRSSAATRNML